MANNIIWLLAFISWIPQGFVVRYVLKKREQRQISLGIEIALVLAPLGLLIMSFSSVGIMLLLAAMYIDIAWGYWLLALVFPTFVGLLRVVLPKRS